jgi:hypothetical protein
MFACYAVGVDFQQIADVESSKKGSRAPSMPSSGDKPVRTEGRAVTWLRAASVIFLVSGALLTGLVVVPMISPETGASVADALQRIVGPEPVGELETISFAVQDIYNPAIEELRRL